MSTKTDQRQLLVLGGPASGKTTYRTQLYQRIEHGNCELRLSKSVSDMTAIDKDVARLVKGLQPMHTHQETYHSTDFSVQNTRGLTLTLQFADYGGEQILQIAQANTVPNAWVERARQSDSWLFFIRIDSVREPKSFITHPVDAGAPVIASEKAIEEQTAGQLDAIETLQRLLFVRGSSVREQLVSPRLGVLLSCWDELPSDERLLSPKIVLQRRAPLLDAFLETNWRGSELRIWGLSSTERRLPESSPDLEFAKKGPHLFGYVVNGDGVQNPDLTIPLNWLT